MKSNENDVKISSIVYPLETFIGGPIKAAIDSQVMMASTTTQFIHTVGFETKDGNLSKPRTIPFSYNRTVLDSSTDQSITEEVQVDVPLLSVVKIPCLEISSLHYTFSVEIKTIDTEDKNSELENSESSLKLMGMIATPKENTRKSDHTTKIHLDIQAIQAETPEGLARVLDLMNQAITPKVISKNIEQKENKKDKFLDIIKNLSDEDILSLIEELRKKSNT